MLTFPAITLTEARLVCPYGDGLLTVPFWRGCLALWSGGKEPPRAPFGCFVVGFVERRGPSGGSGGLVRTFYLSSLGPELDGFSDPGCKSSDNIILPSSIVAGVSAMTQATKFGFDPTCFCGKLRYRLEGLHKFHRGNAEMHAKIWGYRLPTGLPKTHWNVDELPL